jgi:glycosyltransferase involved in cell wall biosynthesis
MNNVDKKLQIGIIQNNLRVGGRGVVISEFIKWCNLQNISPTIFTFSGLTDSALFKEVYGPDIYFKTYSFKMIPITRGNAYQTPLLNFLTASKIRTYDVIFNSGRCPYFLPMGPAYLHYVHFPLERSLDLEDHFHNAAGYLYTMPLKALYWRRANKVRSGIFLANSQFTAAAIYQTYPVLSKDNIFIVYPPCSISADFHKSQEDLDFVSLGAFIEDKRQMEQLVIAQRMPEYNFNLIGRKESPRYFNKCLNFANSNQLDNVKFFPNASQMQVAELLSRAKIYLHTKRNEHFGISTVEAINHGCLPIVHDSGGQKEIVPLKDFRFNDAGEAIEKCRQIIKMTNNEKEHVIKKLREHIKQYSKEKFRDNLNTLLNTFIKKIQVIQR